MNRKGARSMSEEKLSAKEILLACVGLVVLASIGYRAFGGASEEAPTSKPEVVQPISTPAVAAPKPLPEPEASQLAERKPEKAEPVRVTADYEICSKVVSSSQNFLDQISESIGVSSRNIEIIGGIYGGAGDRCKINIMTPLGAMECNSGYIYTDDGGDSYFTRGTELGVNNSCYKR